MSSILSFVFLYFELIFLCFGITEFRCTNRNSSDTQIVTLKCPPNLFINVKEALYGRNQWNECQYLVGDCTETFSIDTECCGRNDCSLAVRRIYSIQCSAYVSFFRVIYECESAEKSTCNIKDDSLVLTEENGEAVLPPTSPDVVISTADSAKVPRDVYIIVGSAATVAFLSAGIVAVLFFLRKFQWHNEKQCILELFIGLCKRHPPDGCENPTEVVSSTGNEKSPADIQHIATLSSLIKPHNSYQEKTTAYQEKITGNTNSINTNINTSLHGIITEVARNNSSKRLKKEFSFDIPQSESDTNEKLSDSIYTEINEIRNGPEGEHVPVGNKISTCNTQTNYTDHHNRFDDNQNDTKVHHQESIDNRSNMTDINEMTNTTAGIVPRRLVKSNNENIAPCENSIADHHNEDQVLQSNVDINHNNQNGIFTDV